MPANINSYSGNKMWSWEGMEIPPPFVPNRPNQIYTNDFLGGGWTCLWPLHAHTHALTLLFHCRLQAARQGVSIHTQSTQRTLTGILRCTRRPARERWKEVCSDRPPIPSPHPPPLLCSRMLSGECVPVISIFTNIIAWIGWIIPDIQEWSGTLPTVVWIEWIIPNIDNDQELCSQ